jgi:hypothetical protein
VNAAACVPESEGRPIRRSYRWACHHLRARPDLITDLHSRTIVGFEIRGHELN